MGIKIELDGKKYDTKIETLHVNTQYVVYINGYRVFINVTLEKPDICGQLTTFKKVIGMGTEGGRSMKNIVQIAEPSSPSSSGQQQRESSRSQAS
jgi:hypothetical protein